MLALASGVAIDAVAVRVTLVPAVLALAGRSAWWLPRRLNRIFPDLDVEGASLQKAPATDDRQLRLDPCRSARRIREYLRRRGFRYAILTKRAALSRGTCAASHPGLPYSTSVEIKCTQCQAADLQPGFVEDGGDHASGYSRWIPGPLERGIFGGAKRWGRPRYRIDAYRCSSCGHLELFAPHEV